MRASKESMTGNICIMFASVHSGEGEGVGLGYLFVCVSPEDGADSSLQLSLGRSQNRSL